MSGGQITFTTNATRHLGSRNAAAVAAREAAGRVDVYGWAVLDKMRDNETNICYDWCEQAMQALNVTAKSHQHYVCFPLYGPDRVGSAPAVCDNACPTGGECAASCPAEGPYSQLPGCGCATCYWAWGAQWKCGSVSQRWELVLLMGGDGWVARLHSGRLTRHPPSSSLP